jgi:hypothetical protein
MHATMSLAAHRVHLPCRARRVHPTRRTIVVSGSSSSREETAPARITSRPDASSTRRAALLSSAALLLAPSHPALAGEASNFLSDLADGGLARKARLFMGPLQLTRDRLDELEELEAQLNVDDLAVALGKATLDCLNPRGALAQYAQVRDVCTLSILVKVSLFYSLTVCPYELCVLQSATKGPAVTNADDSAETVAVRAAANALVTSYDDLGRELAAEATPGSRAAAFEASRGKLRETASALLDCFRLDAKYVDPIRADFPDLFA